MAFFFLLALIGQKLSLADECAIPDADKVDCAYSGITQSGCLSLGCCWAEVTNEPWCFYSNRDLTPAPSITSNKVCSAQSSDKVDCAYSGITESGCNDLGCCWAAVSGTIHVHQFFSLVTSNATNDINNNRNK